MDEGDSTEPAAHLEEEPQDARGTPGSRDTGSDEPSAGPADRPSGGSGEASDTTVDAQGPIDPDSPNMPAGDQAG